MGFYSEGGEKLLEGLNRGGIRFGLFYTMTVMWKADNPGTGWEWEAREKAIAEIQLRDLEDRMMEREEVVRVQDALDARPAGIARGWNGRC